MHSYWQPSCADLLRAGPFPRQGLLGCVPWPEHYPTVFALGFLMVSKVRQAASDPFCLTSSIHGAPSLDAWAEINPFSLELLFFRVFYHSNRKRDSAAQSKSQSGLEHWNMTSVPRGWKTFAKALATA